MTSMIQKVIVACESPLAVLLGDDRVLVRASGRSVPINQPVGMEAESPMTTSLDLRWFGYGTSMARKYWTWLAAARRQAERTFLTLDMLFPVFYGGALAASLSWIWVTLDRPFHPAWIVAPLAVILIADWTEQLIDLAQLCQYASVNTGHLDGLWIRLSGCSTTIKLWLTCGLYMSLVDLVVKLIVTLSHRRLVMNVAP